MPLKYFLAIIACIFSFSFSTYSFTESLNPNGNYEITPVNSENWVLEYHDSTWWWALYGTDGSKIMEIPAEF